ncbi:hypothetical protein FV302_24705 [Escherichia coli]|nr:hypothetical protein FV302_24705 [Escherichia coli]
MKLVGIWRFTGPDIDGNFDTQLSKILIKTSTSSEGFNNILFRSFIMFILFFSSSEHSKLIKGIKLSISSIMPFV